MFSRVLKIQYELPLSRKRMMSFALSHEKSGIRVKTLEWGAGKFLKFLEWENGHPWVSY